MAEDSKSLSRQSVLEDKISSIVKKHNRDFNILIKKIKSDDLKTYLNAYSSLLSGVDGHTFESRFKKFSSSTKEFDDYLNKYETEVTNAITGKSNQSAIATANKIQKLEKEKTKLLDKKRNLQNNLSKITELDKQIKVRDSISSISESLKSVLKQLDTLNSKNNKTKFDDKKQKALDTLKKDLDTSRAAWDLIETSFKKIETHAKKLQSLLKTSTNILKEGLAGFLGHVTGNPALVRGMMEGYDKASAALSQIRGSKHPAKFLKKMVTSSIKKHATLGNAVKGLGALTGSPALLWSGSKIQDAKSLETSVKKENSKTEENLSKKIKDLTSLSRKIGNKNIKNYGAFAKGGAFTTNGPGQMLVGEKGPEKVTVKNKGQFKQEDANFKSIVSAIKEESSILKEILKIQKENLAFQEEVQSDNELKHKEDAKKESSGKAAPLTPEDKKKKEEEKKMSSWMKAGAVAGGVAGGVGGYKAGSWLSEKAQKYGLISKDGFADNALSYGGAAVGGLAGAAGGAIGGGLAEAGKDKLVQSGGKVLGNLADKIPGGKKLGLGSMVNSAAAQANADMKVYVTNYQEIADAIGKGSGGIADTVTDALSGKGGKAGKFGKIGSKLGSLAKGAGGLATGATAGTLAAGAAAGFGVYQAGQAITTGRSDVNDAFVKTTGIDAGKRTASDAKAEDSKASEFAKKKNEERIAQGKDPFEIDPTTGDFKKTPDGKLIPVKGGANSAEATAPSVDFGGWYAKGGSFEVDKPRLIGIGEKGPETVTITPAGKDGITNLAAPAGGNANEAGHSAKATPVIIKEDKSPQTKEQLKIAREEQKDEETKGLFDEELATPKGGLWSKFKAMISGGSDTSAQPSSTPGATPNAPGAGGGMGAGGGGGSNFKLPSGPIGSGEYKDKTGQDAGDDDSKKAKVVGVVEAGPRYTVVKRADGTIEKREGDRNWRNNNPGNISYGEFAKSMGAVGTDGRFAIFPDYETGRKAKQKLIFNGKNYVGLTLSQAIARYAPPNENDTQRYQQAVLAAVGGKDALMTDYTAEEQQKIMDAMQKQEGMRKGKSSIMTGGSTAISPNSVGQGMPTSPAGGGAAGSSSGSGPGGALGPNATPTGGSTSPQSTPSTQTGAAQPSGGAVSMSGGGVGDTGGTGGGADAVAGQGGGAGEFTTIKSASGKTATVASKYAPNFQGLINDMEAAGYQIKSLGGFSDRNMVGGNKKSYHAFGAAIDINPEANPYGKELVTDMPANTNALAAKWGLGWGGNWKSVKDAMHFSVAKGEGGSVPMSRDASMAENTQTAASTLKPPGGGGGTGETASATGGAGGGGASGGGSSSPSATPAKQSAPSAGAIAKSSGGSVDNISTNTKSAATEAPTTRMKNQEYQNKSAAAQGAGGGQTINNVVSSSGGGGGGGSSSGQTILTGDSDSYITKLTKFYG